MSDFWLRCDNCNRSLDDAAAQSMQLVVRFKPEAFPWTLPRLDEGEHRNRCRFCGWVHIFIPAEKSLLTPNWRDISIKKQA
jgi:hypothetical protein